MSPAAPAPTPGTGLQHGLRTPKTKSAHIDKTLLFQFFRVASGLHLCIRRVLIASGLYRRTLRIHTHFHIYIPGPGPGSQPCCCFDLFCIRSVVIFLCFSTQIQEVSPGGSLGRQSHLALGVLVTAALNSPAVVSATITKHLCRLHRLLRTVVLARRKVGCSRPSSFFGAR